MKQFQLDRINKEQPIGGCETRQFSFAKANSEPAPDVSFSM